MTKNLNGLLKRKFSNLKLLGLICLLALFGMNGVMGQQSITVNTAITQDFNSFASSATAALPSGFKIGTDWSTGATATTLAYGTSGTGAVTGTSGGGLINWANGVTASSTDRSLGFLTTGSFSSPRSIIYAFTNNTGNTVTSVNLSWNYEKSRSGSRAFDWTFFHGNTSTASTAETSGDQAYAADANNTVISNPPLSTSKSVSLTGLSITNGSTYYIRWTYTGNGGSSNSQGLSIDDFSITLPAGSSTSSNIILNSSFTHPTNIDYTAFQAASGLTTSNSIEVGQFDIQDGGGSADADALGTTLTACSLTVANFANIRALALFDGTTNLGEITSVTSTAAFSGLTLAATDGGSKTFSVRATFKTSVTDNQQISFTVASATASGAGSSFATANAGGAATSTSGDNNRIEVSTTDIIFDQNVSTVSQNAIMNPSPTIKAIDANVNFDLDNVSNVVMTISTGSTTFGAATTTVAMVAGVATFNNLIFATDATGNNLTATQGAFTDVSAAFDVTPSAPEINVKQSATNLLSGVGTFSAGSVVSGTAGSAITFTIENLGSADLTYSSITSSNTTDFTLDLTSTSSPVAASGNTTFTVTFNPTTAGSKSTTITISNNDADESSYTFTVTGTGSVSATSDIITNVGYTNTSNIDYASFQTASTLTTGNSIGVTGLTIQDGAGAADADNLGTTLTAISFTTGGSIAIRTAALFDGSTNISEVAVNGATSISFSGLTLSASDASTKNFELRVTYQSVVTDNQQITFTVSAATALSTNSGFATGNAGAAASLATGDINRLEVIADRLAFVAQPSNVSINVAMSPSVTVSANDVNNNRDLDYVTDMTATTSGTFAGASTNVVTPVAGLGTFSNIQFSAAVTGTTVAVGSGTLTASGNSNTFNVYEAQPTVQASAINFTNIGMNSMTINWTNGNGANRIVVVKATGTPGTATDGVTYTANTIFGSGGTFGASEFIVYNGSASTVNITNLVASTTYSVKVFEYNGSAGTENYLTTSNNTSQTTSSLIYYSNGSGDPAVLANWKTERNGTGSSPSNFTSGESFIIENGDNMTTTGTWTISGTSSKLQIENGGTLTANHSVTLAAATTFQIDNGGTYIHNHTGTPSSTIFAGTESFGASSNFELDNWVNNTTSITTGVTLPYGNLEINYASNSSNWQNAFSGTINLCAGNFTITSVGTGSFRFAAGTAPTITISGNYTQAAGTVNLASTSGSSITTLNVGGNFAVNGGTFTSTSTGSRVVFNKTGSQTFTNAGTISVVNFEVGSSSILDLGTSVLSGGSFTLPSGATLKTAHASGISGAVTASTRTFSSGANYEFNGAATGTFTTTPSANTVNDLTINNAAGVTLSQNISVAGTFGLTSGKFTLGANTLTINGTISGTGTISGGSTSNLTITGSSGTINFDQTTPGTTNLLRNLTISGTGTTTLGNALNITSGSSFGVVSVGSGATLNTGGNLTLKSDALGTAAITASAGTISGNVTVERFIASAGRRWRFLSSPVQSATIANWMTQFYVTGPGAAGGSVGDPNANGWHTTQKNIDNPSSITTTSIRTYNESVITGDFNTGWENLTGTSQALTPGQGFRTFVRGQIGNTAQIGLSADATSQSALTTSLTGAINSGDVNANPTFTSSGTLANDGWNLLGNPYPCAYNWNAHFDANVGSEIANLDATIYVYDGTANSYKSYNASSNSGTLTNGIIPSGAGFFAKANASSPILVFKETYKTTSAPLALHKTDLSDEFSIKYFKDSTESDEIIVKMFNGATLNKDAFDINKLGNENLNLSSYGTDNQLLTLSAIPFVNGETRIKLNVEAGKEGTYQFNFKNIDQFDAGVSVSLLDKYTNKTTNVKTNTTYSFEMGSAANQWGKDRFELILNGKATTGVNNNVQNTVNTSLSIYPNPASDVLNIVLNHSEKISEIKLLNVSGKLIQSYPTNTNQIDISQFENGVYFIEVTTNKGKLTSKFVK